MTPERWQRVAQIHEAVFALPSHERAAFLASQCGDDVALRHEVESLLAQDSKAGLLDRPIGATAAEILARVDRLRVGAQVGAYRIEGVIGAGGMGEVYRARDTKLGRSVALKVLPAAFASDAERLARFQREAQLLASLNHPHIAAIHGLEDSSDVHALVLELVEGPTLADLIARGPLRLDDLQPIARQIAQALEAAHEQGIIHRDLKPANIKVTPDGVVKVLDFGLARLTQTDGPPAEAYGIASPTITSPATMTGASVILGTAAYMSPEQAKGRPVGKRSDIWAFGCVVYEMLTGRRAFEGEDVAETIANVLKTDPDWTALPAETPAAIRRLLRRCCAKDPRDRLADASTLRLELDEPRGEADATRTLEPGTSHRRERLAWAAAVALLTLVAAIAMVRLFRSGGADAEMRFDIASPPTTDPTSLAISPDAKNLVFVATSRGRPRLWLRPLSAVSAQPLDGTEDASAPFWSPDSHSIAFFDNRKVKALDLDGRSVRTLLDGPQSLGGTWNRDGVILVGGGVGPIVRFSANGGASTPATVLLGQRSHSYPQFLPDGRHFLYYAAGVPEVRGVWVGQLDRPDAKRLVDADAAAVYSSGHLLFVRQGTLFAQPFDPRRLELSGAPAAIAPQVAFGGTSRWAAALSAAEAGPVVYRASDAAAQRQFVRVDRIGAVLGKVGDPDPGYGAPSVSPDFTRLAFSRFVEGNTDVWLLETARGVLSRFTSDPVIDTHPVWSPTDDRIVFQKFQPGSGRGDLYVKSLASGAREELLLSDGRGNIPTDWSPDGTFLLYKRVQADSTRGWGVWVLPMEGKHEPLPVVETEFDERNAQFSPDGKWIAYESDESGRFEVYCQPFQTTGTRERISISGGAQVRWRRDGKELFYLALDGRLMAVPLTLDPGGGVIRPGAPVPLFPAEVGDVLQPVSRQQYLPSADGKSFLLNRLIGQSSTTPITVILNLSLPH